ncbi:helix-turn-helix transcriptional regulator [Fusobacterium nucleatum]|nr:helix-turn-helix transcriptional regulator [Fusobacterium nucleatum]WDF24600.1 helix-turn-helix transcriptional regulator [Fusobacterium nucleatum]
MESTAIVLKKLRESRNLTIVQLAQLAGVGKGTVGDIETGKNKSTIKTLEKISKALKLTEEERGELFSSFVPKDIGVKILKNPLYKELNSRGKKQFEDIIEQSALMFNDENISQEDKEKVLMAIQDAFFDAKKKNQKKK